MKNFTASTLLLSIFSFPLFAQEWGTVFPNEKEVAQIDRAYASQKILVQNHYYPKPGKFNEVLALRIAASKLLKEFGMTAGRVIVSRQTMDRANGKQEEIAAIVWNAEYESLEALKKEINAYTAKQETRYQREILSKMKLLIDRFKRTSSYVMFE
jgi:hypothetical protein